MTQRYDLSKHRQEPGRGAAPRLGDRQQYIDRMKKEYERGLNEHSGGEAAPERQNAQQRKQDPAPRQQHISGQQGQAPQQQRPAQRQVQPMFARQTEAAKPQRQAQSMFSHPARPAQPAGPAQPGPVQQQRPMQQRPAQPRPSWDYTAAMSFEDRSQQPPSRYYDPSAREQAQPARRIPGRGERQYEQGRPQSEERRQAVRQTEPEYGEQPVPQYRPRPVAEHVPHPLAQSRQPAMDYRRPPAAPPPEAVQEPAPQPKLPRETEILRIQQHEMDAAADYCYTPKAAAQEQPPVQPQPPMQSQQNAPMMRGLSIEGAAAGLAGAEQKPAARPQEQQGFTRIRGLTISGAPPEAPQEQEQAKEPELTGQQAAQPKQDTFARPEKMPTLRQGDPGIQPAEQPSADGLAKPKKEKKRLGKKKQQQAEAARQGAVNLVQEEEWKPIIFKPEFGPVSASHYQPEEEQAKGTYRRNFTAPSAPPERSRHIFMVVLLIVVTSMVVGYMFSGVVMNKIIPSVARLISSRMDSIMPTIARLRSLLG